MYFQKFPLTLYSLDNRQSVQVIQNLLLRLIISQEIKTNFSVYDEYDIKDGETPETLAFQLYGDTNLHWLILHLNDIIDPRFDWPLDTYNLKRFIDGKYYSSDAVHHYENLQGEIVNANVILSSNSQFALISIGDVLVNNTYPGFGYVTEKTNNSTLKVRITSGGITTGCQLYVASNSNIFANVTSTEILSGIPITNYNYEESQNETKRRIKILKPQFIERIIKDFDSKLSQINE